MKKLLVLISLLTLSGHIFAMEQAKTVSKSNAKAWYALVDSEGNFAKFDEIRKKEDFDINCRYPGECLTLDRPRTIHETLLSRLCSLPFTYERLNILSAIIHLHPVHSRNPVDANYVNELGATALHNAVLNENPTYLRWLLQHQNSIGLDINKYVNGSWGSALNRAVFEKRREHVHLLAKIPKVDPNVPDDFGRCSLHNAIFVIHCTTEYRQGTSDLETIRDLGELGADTEVKDLEGLTAFERCDKEQFGGRPHNRALALLAIGADVKDFSCDFMISTDLFQNDNKECADFLFDCFRAAMGHLKTNYLHPLRPSTEVVNAQDKTFGMSGLMWAAARGNVKLAKKIIELGANPLLTDAHGDTALHHAVRNGHIEVALYLQKLEPLALTVKNYHERTPVDVAISSKKSREMFLALAQ